MSRTQRIEQVLTETFAPLKLQVEDDSEAHRGHGGYRDGGETHYNVSLTSAALNGLSRVARQRLVYKALQPEFDTGLHALALTLSGTE